MSTLVSKEVKILIFAAAALLFASPADNQENKAKIARALSAGPAEITRNARVVDMDSQGKMTVLREGSNGFTCMPGNPKVIGDPPMCEDAASMQWGADFKAHKPKPTNMVPGITYMLAGATQRSDTDPYDKTSPPIPIGPHWMIMWPFHPKATGLPTKHRKTVLTSCGPARLTLICMSWGVHDGERCNDSTHCDATLAAPAIGNAIFAAWSSGPSPSNSARSVLQALAHRA